MGEMMERPSVPLEQLILESKDGEWGEAAEKSGYILCNIIRGTDFRNTSNTNIKFPQRYIKQHLADRKRLQPFDLLIETAGGTATQSTGKTVLVKESLLSGSGTPFLCSSFARYIRLKKDGINPQFLQYFLEALYKNDYMRVYNTQHTGVSRFQWSDFKKRTAIPLPPAPVQVNIAAILSAYDDMIENNNRRIAVLEKMAEEVYREWFVRMSFPGHEKVKFHKGVPEGWKRIKVGDAFQFTGGGTPSTEENRYWQVGDVNWYTPSDITAGNGTFLLESKTKCTKEGVRNSSARLFPPYSIMMTSRATIGAIAINTTDACTNQGFITCFPNDRYPLVFLYHWLKLNKPNFEILSSGATFTELIKSVFRRIEILTPPEETVTAFETIVRPLFNKIENTLRGSRILKHSRDLLLSGLITGKLSVEDLDIKFPPSMRGPEPAEGREADA